MTPKAKPPRIQFSNYLFILPQLLLFAFFLALPVFRGIQISLFDWKIMAPTQRFLGLQNYTELFKDPTWWRALRASFTFTALVMLFNTTLALGVALLLKRNFAGRNFLRMAFYLPGVLSVTVIGIVAYRVFDPRAGLLNNFVVSVLQAQPIQWWSGNTEMLILVATTVWWTFGFPLLVFIAGLRGIPDNIYEAARMDGAGAWQTLWRITWPLLTPTLLFVFSTQFITHMQMFGQAYQLGSGDSQTVFVYMFDTTWKFFRFGYASAMGVVLTLIIVLVARVIFALFSRRFEY